MITNTKNDQKYNSCVLKVTDIYTKYLYIQR